MMKLKVLKTFSDKDDISIVYKKNSIINLPYNEERLKDLVKRKLVELNEIIPISEKRYIIMADGQQTRWNNYQNTPKHLIEIEGEPLLYRTVRLLKKYGAEDIYITSHDERYNIVGTNRYEPNNNIYEIDRFYSCLPIWGKETIFMYGDVFYTEEAIKTIINTDTTDFEFFGRYGQRKEYEKNNGEIFAIKVKDKNKFQNACFFIREGLIKGTIKRGIGWDVYRTLLDIPLNKHEIKGHFTRIEDETEDFDFPKDFDNFIKKK